jgi:hypothetical protein
MFVVMFASHSQLPCCEQLRNVRRQTLLEFYAVLGMASRYVLEYRYHVILAIICTLELAAVFGLDRPERHRTPCRCNGSIVYAVQVYIRSLNRIGNLHSYPHCDQPSQ